jgi:DNA-binding NtrC family response regulator
MPPTSSSTVLMVGGDPALQRIVHEVVAPNPVRRLENVESLSGAVVRASRGDVALVLVHLADRKDAAQVARLLKGGGPHGRGLPTVVISDLPDVELTLKLLKMGVTECLKRPLDLRRLSFLVDTIVPRPAAAHGHESGPPPRGAVGDEPLVDLLPLLGPLAEHVRRVAGLNVTVFLTGETGTGKTCLSRAIHELSPRAAQPFVTLNCGAHDSLHARRELFGYVDGAFPGAVGGYVGRLGQAGEGTLLLDGVDLLGPRMQAALLRVLDERVYAPLGATATEPFAARLIVTTNQCIADEVAAGRFRSDLLYRLNVAPLHLAPLRECRGLICPLAERFVQACGQRHGLLCGGLSAGALEILEAFGWPGNVRQLRNVIEDAVIRCGGGTIECQHLPEPVRESRATAALPAQPAVAAEQGLDNPPRRLARARDDAERAALRQALEQHRNNRSSAAIELGISRVALYKKLRKYGLA